MGAQGWDLCGIKEDNFIFKRNMDTDTDTHINPHYPCYPYYTYPPYTNPPYIITSTANLVSATI